MRYCIFCGVKVPGDAKYCQTCGKEQPEDTILDEDEEEDDTPKGFFDSKRNLILAGVGGFVIVLLVATGLMIWLLKV